MRQAEKFNRPIVCLVDTQGAFCGMEAEERGQGNAIAENLELMAGLRVPIVSVLLGEGGSAVRLRSRLPTVWRCNSTPCTRCYHPRASPRFCGRMGLVHPRLPRSWA